MLDFTVEKMKEAGKATEVDFTDDGSDELGRRYVQVSRSCSLQISYVWFFLSKDKSS